MQNSYCDHRNFDSVNHALIFPYYHDYHYYYDAS
jgi:hypothetical protein